MSSPLYWIALSMVSGIGPVLFKRLVGRFGTPEEVFKASVKNLKEVEGVGERLASLTASFDGWREAEDELSRTTAYGGSIVTMADRDYPVNLLNIHDPPPFLYVKGRLAGEERSMAVVGSRTASIYGKKVTEGLTRELAVNGFTIVSGMARGIDTAAHQAAVSAGGRTVAVLGSGIDVIYPPENKKLYEEIARRGAVISELPMGTQPLGENFPARNRIISGISLGTLVIEASLKSGSLITAACAAEQGREVFAVPGNITTGGASGTHRLIKDGAKLVERIEDITAELGQVQTKTRPLPAMTSEEAVIVDKLAEPVQIDEISYITGLDVRSLSSILLKMELNGLVRQLPGMLYVRNI